MNVLLATDGSPYALEAARFLAGHLDPGRVERVTVAAVEEPEHGPDGTEGGSGRGGRGPAGESRSWAEAVQGLFPQGTYPVEIRVEMGRPEDRLPALAREGDIDLVVAGVKGRGAAPFFELGRVATALKDGAEVPTLLVRPPPGPRDGNGGPTPLRVLVPVERSREGVEAALRPLGAFRLAPGSLEVGVLRPDPGRFDPAAEGVASFRVLHGRPGREIERRIVEGGMDVVVLLARAGAGASRGRGFFAEELAWVAPCSVLLVPEPHRSRPLSGPAGARPGRARRGTPAGGGTGRKG
jgi:nucleotide-binding universal stress UspA family protein